MRLINLLQTEYALCMPNDSRNGRSAIKSYTNSKTSNLSQDLQDKFFSEAANRSTKTPSIPLRKSVFLQSLSKFVS